MPVSGVKCWLKLCRMVLNVLLGILLDHDKEMTADSGSGDEGKGANQLQMQ